MTKNPLNIYTFERAMQEWFAPASTKQGRKCSYWSGHAKPLVKAGYLIPDREIQHPEWTEIWFKPTPAGIRWWIDERLALLSGPIEAEPLASDFEGKGIGYRMTFSLMYGHQGAIFRALRDGLLEFVSHSDYSRIPHGCDESITVELNKTGYDFFGALPRFVEVY